MSYLLLAAAIGSELIATTCLKYSAGFTKLVPSIICVVMYIVCYLAFAKALNGLNLAVAYATWCGIGIAASSVISWFLFGEKLNTIGLLAIVLIIAGVILLNCFGVAGE